MSSTWGCLGRGREEKLPGQLLMSPLIAQLKYKSMKIMVSAALQRQFHSPFIFREEDPSRQVSPWEPCRTGLRPDSLGKGWPCSSIEFSHNPWLHVPAGENQADLWAVRAATEKREKSKTKPQGQH